MHTIIQITGQYSILGNIANKVFVCAAATEYSVHMLIGMFVG